MRRLRLLLVVATLDCVVSIPSKPASTPLQTDAMCTGSSVAYVFLARAGLPLWDTWKRYFEGCPSGSFIVLVHTQEPGAAQANISQVGGFELPPEETVNGSLRFSYKMVQAMLNLYGGVQRIGRAGNGCSPRFIHTVSDACAPVTSCASVHTTLEAPLFEGSSLMQIKEDYGVPKASQWVTLWTAHAYRLHADQREMREEFAALESDGSWEVSIPWDNGFHIGPIRKPAHWGALDEFVWPRALASRSLPYVSFGLTHVDWEVGDGAKDPVSWDGKESGSPYTFRSSEAAALAVREARANSKGFARKFEATPEVLKVLEAAVASSTSGVVLAA